MPEPGQGQGVTALALPASAMHEAQSRGSGGSVVALHPEHMTDLREKSGLSTETILAAGIRSLAPAEWPRYLSQRLAAKAQSCYLIPYPEADAFYRVKLFPPVPDKDGHTIRYYQPAGTPRASTFLSTPGQRSPIPLSRS